LLDPHRSTAAYNQRPPTLDLPQFSRVPDCERDVRADACPHDGQQLAIKNRLGSLVWEPNRYDVTNHVLRFAAPIDKVVERIAPKAVDCRLFILRPCTECPLECQFCKLYCELDHRGCL